MKKIKNLTTSRLRNVSRKEKKKKIIRRYKNILKEIKETSSKGKNTFDFKSIQYSESDIAIRLFMYKHPDFKFEQIESTFLGECYMEYTIIW